MSHTQQDEISITSFKRDFERYSWNSLRSDILAGLSVAMLTVPQALAYALVAGLPYLQGFIQPSFLRSLLPFSVFPPFDCGPQQRDCDFGSRGDFGNFIYLLPPCVRPARDELAMQILTQLMLSGRGHTNFGSLFKMGRLTHFVSHTVIIAYVSGVALALVINQLFPLLGIWRCRRMSLPFLKGAHTFYLT